MKFFDQNHELTLSEKWKFCDFYKAVFLWSKKASFFYLERQQTLFLEEFCRNRNNKDISNF